MLFGVRGLLLLLLLKDLWLYNIRRYTLLELSSISYCHTGTHFPTLSLS